MGLEDRCTTVEIEVEVEVNSALNQPVVQRALAL